jgi:hypothetical protein
LRILTSGQHAIGTPGGRPTLTPDQRAYEQMVKTVYDGWLALSTNAREIEVEHSSENIELDRPDALVAAVRDVYEQTRR